VTALARLARVAVGGVGTAAGAVGAVGGVYVAALTAASFGCRRPSPGSPRLRFAIVVPAHNEEDGLGATLRSLAAIDYPTDLRRVVVVADNCTDGTAQVARDAGVEVIERTDLDNRGKGFALDKAFSTLLAEPVDARPDALVVVDADTVVARSLLVAFGAAVDAGAEVVQADYRVLNHDANWRTQLMDVAFTCQHRVRGAGRERLGLSAGLRGNGMMFTRHALLTVPYGAWSAVEDIEYGIQLGLHGMRVHFAAGTWVDGDMPTGSAASGTQRTRWELGRQQLQRTYRPRLIAKLRERPDRVTADLLADITVPPLSTVAITSTAALVGGLVARSAAARRLGAFGLVALGAHAAVGMFRSKSGIRALPAMARAPWYAVWKIALRLSPQWRRQRSTGADWARTEREHGHDQMAEPDVTLRGAS
jgi:1,2-diacylglycerol 3-beta-glucosyltransferase